ncbi:MAG: hypothetical protein HON53_14315 [Planctomycetaceae bacterium]|jgi:hypothetical protein|nr:hypothetical protein [Planctomycetaceae bacterium]MBT6156158.1 hypothetical protein [Planctomycetaceae bacterium]MBT6484652.1 hypothetical protein [Planctomycetaceae bacterium]MBT6497098.1 hypothetical protein [Planctomycetaceae bacterium]
MYRAILTTAAIVWGMSATAEAQVKLQLKFPNDAKTTSTVTSKTHQMLKIAGMDVETKAEETVSTTTTNGKRKADGTIQLTSKVDSVKSKLTLPGGVDLEFDSTKPSEPAGTAFDFLLEVYAVIPKVVSTTVLNKDNRVTSVKVDEKPLEDLSDMAKTILKGRFDGDYLKEVVNKQMDRIPKTAVKKGDSWQVELTANLGGGQTLAFKTTYTYEGTIEKDGKTLDKITSKVTEVKYAQDDPDAPAKVTASELKVESSSGTLLFDRKLGRTVSDTDKFHVTGTMTLDINGMEFPTELDLTIEKTTTEK